MKPVDEVPVRTLDVDYTGGRFMDHDDLHDRLVDLFTEFGLTIEGTGDRPADAPAYLADKLERKT